MEWRTPREPEERPFGIWSRADLEESIAEEHRADVQLNRMLGANRAVETKRELGITWAQPTGEFKCPECGAVRSTAAAVGAHRQGRHGIPGESRAARSAQARAAARSLHVA